MTIENKNRVDAESIKTFREIDVISVIKEHVLYKGIECVSTKRTLLIKDIVPTALYHYGLKKNPTNVMYADYGLTLSAKRQGLFYPYNGKQQVQLSVEPFEELKEEDFKFRNTNSNEPYSTH